MVLLGHKTLSHNADRVRTPSALNQVISQRAIVYRIENNKKNIST